MFLQNILDFDTADFTTAGEKMLVSEGVRYYVKYVFYEILGQISEPDDNIIQFIADECENELYGDYLLNNVIFSRKQYVSVLRREGILEKWFEDLLKKKVVFRLLQSICYNLDLEDIAFIRERAFKNKEDDMEFIKCFGNDFSRERDEMFDLRMMFYQHYPNFSGNLYIDLKSMLSQCELRTIRLITFLLTNNIQSKDSHLFRHHTDMLMSNNVISISNGKAVLDILLPYIPASDSWKVMYSEWSGKYRHMRGIERCCIELIKKTIQNYWNNLRILLKN